MHPIRPEFTAVHGFTARDEFSRAEYIAWMNCPQVVELISLDMLLCPCPSVFEPITDEDWRHCICVDFRTGQFDDLAYLLQRVAGVADVNILGLYHEPSSHVSQPPAPGFSFIGYELMSGGISSVTNCGEWVGVFGGADLNRHGLLPSFEKATEVRRLMLEKYPDEPHAKCVLYALWRMDPHPAENPQLNT